MAAAVVAMALACTVGAAHPDWRVAFSEPDSLDRLVLGARASRVALGALAGGALAVAGAVLQALLRNPLGDPYALGISGGAALGATVSVLLASSWFPVPLGAFVGAGLCTAVILAMARRSGRVDPMGLLLAGLVANAFTGALLALLRSLTVTAKAQDTLSLLLGAIREESPGTVGVVALLVTAGLALITRSLHALDVIAVGEESAAGLGVDVPATAVRTFVATSVLVAAVVSVCGMIPFVGLLVPFHARRVVGPGQRFLLPACFAAGAGLVVLADALTRLAFVRFGTEPPVGALTALIGAPFFLRRLDRATLGARL